ncbi:GerAB/ArcD/ProY family transporter [Brevibacillus choshinensis]|uniref:Endospore germination permease n=1 Tax=Brevibacillus choshinensis TaxID=54911 RepID=A0ABX7FGC8_BRECH|nr:endospore germination permease [Brevibacillus choshinensis]QRG65081.1 endospore germination permease [Brevibacillus choshinensis]
MLEQGKISGTQAAMILYSTIMSTAMIIGPSIMAKRASNDLWISPIWASLMGFLAVFIACHLHKRFPKLSIIQQSEQIVGVAAGKVIGFLYLFILVQINGCIVREYTEFITLFLRDTPTIIVSAVLVMVCVYAVQGGIEVLARSAQVFFPLFVAPLVVMILLVLKDMEPQSIFPVLENGLIPTFEAAILPQAWFSEAFLLSFLLPFLDDRKNGKRAAMITVFASMITMIVANLTTWFLMGDVSKTLMFPIMDVARYISVADFFENLESGVMAIWVIGVFIKVSIFLYASVLGTAQWLQLSNYRLVALPIGWLTVLFSFWGLPNFATLSEWNIRVVPFYLSLFFVIMPGILLLFSFFSRKRSKVRGVDSG